MFTTEKSLVTCTICSDSQNSHKNPKAVSNGNLGSQAGLQSSVENSFLESFGINHASFTVHETIPLQEKIHEAS